MFSQLTHVICLTEFFSSLISQQIQNNYVNHVYMDGKLKERCLCWAENQIAFEKYSFTDFIIQEGIASDALLSLVSDHKKPRVIAACQE